MSDTTEKTATNRPMEPCYVYVCSCGNTLTMSNFEAGAKPGLICGACGSAFAAEQDEDEDDEYYVCTGCGNRCAEVDWTYFG